MNPTPKAYILAISACLIWSTNFIIARYFNAEIPPIALSFWRWFFTALLLLCISHKKIIKNFHQVRENIYSYCILAILGVSTFNSLIYHAGHYTSSTNLSLLISTAPIWIVILSSLFKSEVMTIPKIAGAILATAGALILLSEGNLSEIREFSFNKGDILVLLAAFVWSIYTIRIDFLPKQTCPISFLFYISLIGTIILLPLYITEYINTGYYPFKPIALLTYLYLASFISLIGLLSWNKAIAIIGPSRVGIVYYTIPIFTSISSTFILQESIYWYHIISFAIIFSGIIISSLPLKKNYDQTSA